MNEKKRKELLEAARAIKDFCKGSDCFDCPFDGRGCRLVPKEGELLLPVDWRLPDE